MGAIKFELDSKETTAAKEFIEKHKNCCKEKLGKEFFSTTGGGFTYIITPTGLGICVSIRCNSCGKIKDITNSNNW